MSWGISTLLKHSRSWHKYKKAGVITAPKQGKCSPNDLFWLGHIQTGGIKD